MKFSEVGMRRRTRIGTASEELRCFIEHALERMRPMNTWIYPSGLDVYIRL